MTIKTPCLDCGRIGTGTRCDPCRRKRKRETYGSAAYRAWGRPTGLRCVLRIKCQGAPATTWDHIDGNPRNNALSNRQPACGSCNPSKGNRT